MGILNFSTSVSSQKTVGEIQGILAKHSATSIMVKYEAGAVSAIAFQVMVGESLLSYRLPCDWQPVLRIIQRRGSGVPRRFQSVEQAQRIAWRIVKDWLEAQMAIVQCQMVKIDQVFLPYEIGRDGRTVYEIVSGSRLALPSPAKAEPANGEVE